MMFFEGIRPARLGLRKAEHAPSSAGGSGRSPHPCLWIRGAG
jgi:hypothetical protein